MKNFDYLHFFDNSNDSASKKRANKQRQGRTLRIEELEGREMLAATPWTLADDVFSQSLQHDDDVVIVDTAVPQVVNAPLQAADTITVTSTADSGVGSLRAAIEAANGGDTIAFASDLHIKIDTELVINKSLIIDAGEYDITIDAQQKSRVFNITGNNINVILAGLTITGGNTTSSGGGIYPCGNLALTGFSTICILCSCRFVFVF